MSKHKILRKSIFKTMESGREAMAIPQLNFKNGRLIRIIQLRQRILILSPIELLYYV